MKIKILKRKTKVILCNIRMLPHSSCATPNGSILDCFHTEKKLEVSFEYFPNSKETDSEFIRLRYEIKDALNIPMVKSGFHSSTDQSVILVINGVWQCLLDFFSSPYVIRHGMDARA